MHPLNTIKILFCGHFALDNIIRFSQERKQTLGGGVTYGSLALKTYSKEVWIGIISSLGSIDFEEQLLDEIHNKNIDLEGVTKYNTKNTNFVLNYYNNSRDLRLISKSPNLDFVNLPANYIELKPNGIILCPLCNEIDEDYIKSLKENLKDTYIAIDIQGFIRRIDDSGRIHLRKDDDFKEEISNIVELVDEMLILKGSEEEMQALSGIDDPTEAIKKLTVNNALTITTLGTNGSIISKIGKDIIKIPAYQSEQVVDETGAGDAYMSVFLYEFLKSSKDWESIKRAGHLASAAASFLIEGKGPKGFKSKEAVLERIETKKHIY